MAGDFDGDHITAASGGDGLGDGDRAGGSQAFQPLHLAALLAGGPAVAYGQAGDVGSAAWRGDAPDGVVLVPLDFHLYDVAVESVVLAQRGPAQRFEQIELRGVGATEKRRHGGHNLFRWSGWAGANRGRRAVWSADCIERSRVGELVLHGTNVVLFTIRFPRRGFP
ncbi:hypothetical protein ACFVT1_40820 [Streptomyces sp. NPDC057963]|uniref:hypothetical protein n=1 Tax=Streptomyces sp. NPDC057963 TaxID=3346290 RepID=UPI0036E9F3AC